MNNYGRLLFISLSVTQSLITLNESVHTECDSITSLKDSNFENCTSFCINSYYQFAGLINDSECLCSSNHSFDPCEGIFESVNFEMKSTNLRVPGPPEDIEVLLSSLRSLKLGWKRPRGVSETFVSRYKVRGIIDESFTDEKLGFESKEQFVKGSLNQITFSGLEAGVKYNVSIWALGPGGWGPPASSHFWTEIDKPDVPKTPVILSQSNGTLLLSITPLEKNNYGPISAYRIIVIIKNDKFSSFYPDLLSDWKTATGCGLHYWIAAEIPASDLKSRFLVGDDKVYGKYHNVQVFDSDYSSIRIILGVVSSINNVTKVSYSPFEFNKNSSNSSSNSFLRLGFIVVSSLLSLFLILLGYFHGIKIFSEIEKHLQQIRQKNESHQLSIVKVSNESRSEEVFEASTDEYSAPVSSVSQMKAIRRSVTLLSKNQFHVSEKRLGIGKYGSVFSGSWENESIYIQVISKTNHKDLSRDLEMVLRTGPHPVLPQLLGLCEESELLYVLYEAFSDSLKDVLLNSRALLHYPVYAEKNNKFTTIKEENLFHFLSGICSGLSHLIKHNIYHKKLCARHISVSSSQNPKIFQIGITEMIREGIEYDYTRWSAPETFSKASYRVESEVWSFGVLMWEILSLGATPYSEFSQLEVSSRIQRGSRLPQMNYISDELYQILLSCWKPCLEDRPDFNVLETQLQEIHLQATTHANFSNYSGFSYENYNEEKEINNCRH